MTNLFDEKWMKLNNKASKGHAYSFFKKDDVIKVGQSRGTSRVILSSITIGLDQEKLHFWSYPLPESDKLSDWTDTTMLFSHETGDFLVRTTSGRYLSTRPIPDAETILHASLFVRSQNFWISAIWDPTAISSFSCLKGISEKYNHHLSIIALAEMTRHGVDISGIV